MYDNENISDSKLAKLAKHLSRELAVTQEEAFEVIYEEWDLVESLYHAHKKTKAVKEHLVKEINEVYRIA